MMLHPLAQSDPILAEVDLSRGSLRFVQDEIGMLPSEPPAAVVAYYKTMLNSIKDAGDSEEELYTVCCNFLWFPFLP